MSERTSLFLGQLLPYQRRPNFLNLFLVDFGVLVGPDDANVRLVLGFLDLLHEVGEQVLLLHLFASRLVRSFE